MTPARVSQLLALHRLAPDVRADILAWSASPGLEALTGRSLRVVLRHRDLEAQRATYLALRLRLTGSSTVYKPVVEGEGASILTCRLHPPDSGISAG